MASPRSSTPSSIRKDPLHVEITPGPQCESTVAEHIIEEHARGKAFMADTAYDSDAIRNKVKSRKMKAVTCPHPTRNKKWTESATQVDIASTSSSTT